jgi:protein TonB
MKYLVITILILFSTQIRAQEEENSNKENIYNTAGIQVQPEFPGGIQEFYKYINQNYKTPKVNRLKGKVFVTFIIEKDGSVNDIKVLRDIGHGTGEEAIRILKMSPAWKPGEFNGEKVRVQYALPININ